MDCLKLTKTPYCSPVRMNKPTPVFSGQLVGHVVCTEDPRMTDPPVAGCKLK